MWLFVQVYAYWLVAMWTKVQTADGWGISEEEVCHIAVDDIGNLLKVGQSDIGVIDGSGELLWQYVEFICHC